MAKLRDPDDGCPWDLEQSFETIAPHTIEEAYEVAEAIARRDMQELKDELGDLMFQVVFYAQMAREIGEFDFNDVVRAVSEKMIRRHPHVFGDEDARRKGLPKGMWEQIKAEEKSEKQAARAARGLPPKEEQAGYLDSVPLTQPALTRALKLQQKASRVGFDWGAAEPILDKIEEEIAELRAAMAEGRPDLVAGELGDVLFAVVNLGRHLEVDAEDSLRKTNDKFRDRFHYIERALKAQGRSLDEASLDEMEELWQQAKAAE